MLQDLHTASHPDDDHTSRMKRAVISAVVAAVCLLIVAYVDKVTGWKVSVLLFYLIPVCIAAFGIGFWGGAIASFASVGTWFAVAMADADRPMDLRITLWNAIMRLGVFLLVAGLIGLIQRYRTELHKLRNSLPW